MYYDILQDIETVMQMDYQENMYIKVTPNWARLLSTGVNLA